MRLVSIFFCIFSALLVVPARASVVALTNWIEGQNGAVVQNGSNLDLAFHSGATISWDAPGDLIYLNGPGDTDLGNFSCLWIPASTVDRDFTITISGLNAYPYHAAVLDLGSKLLGNGTYAFSSVRLTSDGAPSAAELVSGWGGAPVYIQRNSLLDDDITFSSSIAGVQSGAAVALNHSITTDKIEFKVHQVAGDGVGLSFGSYLAPISVPEPSSLAFFGITALIAVFHRNRK